MNLRWICDKIFEREKNLQVLMKSIIGVLLIFLNIQHLLDSKVQIIFAKIFCSGSIGREHRGSPEEVGCRREPNLFIFYHYHHSYHHHPYHHCRQWPTFLYFNHHHHPYYHHDAGRNQTFLHFHHHPYHHHYYYHYLNQHHHHHYRQHICLNHCQARCIDP